MIYMKVHGNEISYRCCLMRYYLKGYQHGLQGLPKRDSTCISYMYSSPVVVLVVEQRITVFFKDVETCL